ncbi:MAG: 6-phosphofructokinase, partial [Elusimicrobia bacterium]|nr:6-phosphofructokinase [Elusimicrobiota bacterium]
MPDTIAVLTSGGDAPGMNAAVRAVVRAASERGWETLGVRRGFEGLIAGDFRPLGARDVGGVMQAGGTILGSSRSEAFRHEAGRRTALERLGAAGVSALVAVGGNGTQQGAAALDRAG